MKKLTLEVAELKVESFETFVSARNALGTVRAHGGYVTITCPNAPDTQKNGKYAITFACCG